MSNMFHQKSISVSRAFTLFIVTSMVLLAVSLCIPNISQTSQAIEQQNRVASEAQQSAIETDIVFLLDTWERILQDFASLPLLTQTVMQPEVNKANIKDFMQDYRILGEQYPITILDFEGEPIYLSEEVQSEEYSDVAWVKQLMTKEFKTYKGSTRRNDRVFWVIAVPVIYNNMTEGIVIAEIPVTEIGHQLSIDDRLRGINVRLTFNDSEIAEFGPRFSGDGAPLHKSLFGIAFEWRSNQENIIQTREKIILQTTIIAAFLTILVIAIAIYLAKRIFVKSIKLLQHHSAALANGSEVTMGISDINIKELQELGNDFQTMKAKIIKREKALMNTQSQLIQSEKLASIGQLAAGVAHEINNPVGFIKSNTYTLGQYMEAFKTFIDMVLDGKSTEDIQAKAQELDIAFILTDIPSLLADNEEGILRVETIVKSLRDFSCIDQTLEFAEGDINEGIESTLIIARNEIKYVAKVEKDYSATTPIMCNMQQINQVFLNILVNAAQALKECDMQEAKLIRIRTWEDETWCYCQISDNGPGIPSDVADRIFDPFFTTKAAGKGTGLGLNVSYDIIVNKHKGDIKVDTKHREGTTFTIELPKVRSDE